MTDVDGRAPGRIADTADEQPIYLSAGPQQVFGVATWPTCAPADLGLVFLHPRDLENSAHRNRLAVRMSRELAALGIHSVRLDGYGTGDSTGVLEPGVSDQVVLDIRAAADWLAAQGVTRLGLVGSCWGATIAATAAPTLPDLVGLCLFSPPRVILKIPVATELLHKPLKKALRATFRRQVFSLMIDDPEYRRWLRARVVRRLSRNKTAAVTRPGAPSPHAGLARPTGGIKPLSDIAGAGVRMHLFYGTNDGIYFDDAARQAFRELAKRPMIEVIPAPDSGHNIMGTLAGQELGVREVRRWVDLLLAR